jgi:hypothetical protein
MNFLRDRWHWQCQDAPRTAIGSLITGRNDLREHEQAAPGVVSRHHLMLTSKKGISALQIQRMMGFGLLPHGSFHVPQDQGRALSLRQRSLMRHRRGR